MVVSLDVKKQLVCPATQSELKDCGAYLESTGDPSIHYPIVGGIPILIDDNKSLFSIEDFVSKKSTTFDLAPKNPLKKNLKKLIPQTDLNVRAEQNYRQLASLLPNNAKILVVGGSIQGQGMEPIFANESFEIIGSDVSFGECTAIVCDAHDLPFKDQTFDCVIVQAVLEHVLDPARCVAEIHRVLKADAIVYAETPFMQQVHMKQYDFTRFTHLGHRWLFKNFEEIASGPCCGPAMALSWSYTAFLRSFATSTILDRLLYNFAHLTSFFFKYFDYLLIDRPGSYDAASGYYFMGRKSDRCLTYEELIQQFQGIK